MKINQEIIINIVKEGKKIAIFAKLIEIGIKICARLDYLIKFLLSIRLVAAVIIES